MAREPISSAGSADNSLTGPVRTCIGCRQRAAKRELLRVTAGSEASGSPAVVPDPTSTAPGRGAHLHPTTECYDLAVRRKAFGRALRVPAGISSAPLADWLAAQQEPPRT